MKFMSTWSVIPGAVKTAAQHFLSQGGADPEGVTVLGRWHSVDCSGGFTLYETNDLTALHQAAAQWADELEIATVPVIEDGEAGPSLAKVFTK